MACRTDKQWFVSNLLGHCTIFGVDSHLLLLPLSSHQNQNVCILPIAWHNRWARRLEDNVAPLRLRHRNFRHPHCCSLQLCSVAKFFVEVKLMLIFTHCYFIVRVSHPLIRCCRLCCSSRKGLWVLIRFVGSQTRRRRSSCRQRVETRSLQWR
jgi:hypothetical protein